MITMSGLGDKLGHPYSESWSRNGGGARKLAGYNFKSIALACLSIYAIWSLFGQHSRLGKVSISSESGRLGAVSSESAICSRIGIEMLETGGNAADAAVATTLCVGTVGMYHSGIGGGGFAVIRSANGSYETIDFREAAPRSAFQDMFKNRTRDSIVGGRASGVPGELKGLQYIHDNYGLLPWRSVVAPAVQVAREGFVFGPDLERAINVALNGLPRDDDEDLGFLTRDASWALDFAPGGLRVRKGEVMIRKRYADTLETIGARGADTLYTGHMAQRIVDATNNSITLRDLREYSVRRLRTANITYKDHRIFSTVAPSSGAIALSVLKMVEGFNDFSLADEDRMLNQSTHRLVESFKFAFAQRAKMGDPAFVPGMDQYQDWILSEAVARANRDKISDHGVLDTGDYNPDGYQPPESHGTAHVVTADHTGLSVSLTSTVNLLFGSRTMDLETGIIMNNVMNDFSIPGVSNEYGYAPSPANFVRPGKRPLSSTTPVFVEHRNGTLQLVIGAAGGSRIISSTVQSILHLLHQNMTMTQALGQPRLHDQLIPTETGFEAGYDEKVISFLAARGHNVTLVPSTLSAVQGIVRRPDGVFDAASEPRQRNSGAFVI